MIEIEVEQKPGVAVVSLDVTFLSCCCNSSEVCFCYKVFAVDLSFLCYCFASS
jgi:hypothetical protein